jgi:aryl-alcohol dehydrogenase-like predicted oxidoreductase
MAVYVDDAFVHGDWGRWTGGGHMQADTADELHAMAARLGLRREWLQSKPTRPWHDHYDLTRERRELAIELGAIPGGRRETVRRIATWRATRQAVGMNKTSFLGDKPVNRIGFGAMQLAGPGVFGPPRDPDGVRAVLRRAVELGVDHIDTAQYYGPDVVNDLIRETLHPYPEELKLVTKVGGRRDDKGAWLPAQTPAELRSGVEDNLRSLRVERMDLVNLRLMSADPSTDLLAQQIGALEDLRSEGKLDLIGISEASPEAVRRALELVDLGEVQNAYSVVNRAGEDVLQLCIEREVAFVPYFPLGSAFTGGPKQLAADPAIASVAERRGITATQVALAWLLARYDRILLIPGTSSVAHLEENMAAADVELDEQDLAELENATQLGNPVPPAHD